ncbi:RING-variant domain [Popillia japonica]|uniref:RING-variant domain n=1 Tax=Popillia japonica TaxID=7064 RepID=A0AAW1JEE4_POPJA
MSAGTLVKGECSISTKICKEPTTPPAVFGTDTEARSLSSATAINSNELTHSVAPSISASSVVCRICQTHSAQEVLISPCNCKGTLAYVHLSCLERWLNQASRSYCELCMFHFNSIQTQRYGFCEGVRLWIRHPRNRSHVQSDVVIAALLTTVTIGLITVCLLGMQYFVIEAKKLGITQGWTKGFVSGFLCVILLGYIVTLYLIVRDQFIPWYNWWKNTVDVRLLLTPSVTKMAKQNNKETST